MLLPDNEDKEDLIDDPIIDEEDQEETEENDVEVDLEDDADKIDREAKDRNKAFASMRIENKELKNAVDTLTQQVSNLATKTTAPRTTTPASPAIPQTDAEWDELADKDWKKAVDLRSIQNAQNIMAKQQQATKAESALEEAKQKVIATHPELNDNNSEKAKIYLTILDANPDYLTQPRGPLYAMRDMEDYMENTLGYKRSEIRSAERAGAEREASRQNRIVLNKGVGRTSNASSENKVVVSKDEMEFCKFHNIDPKEYAKNKQKLSKSSAKEGVSI